jgi:hypothetical protein
MVFILQLPARAGRVPVPSVHPYQVARLKGWGWGAVRVGAVCLPHLRVTHLGPGHIVDEFQSFCCGLGFPLLRRVYSYIQFKVVTWMVAEICEKWRQGGGIGYLIVACKFRQKEVVNPIILEVSDMYTEVLFDHCIHLLYLSVGLGLKYRRELWINFETRAEVFPEMGCELEPTVRHNCFW